MATDEDRKNFKMLIPILIYSFLTYLWFHENANNDLPLIGLRQYG